MSEDRRIRRPKEKSVRKGLEVGKEYEVNITEVNRKGDGIARIQRFVIFVKNGKVGQNTKIRIISMKGKSARAELVD